MKITIKTQVIEGRCGMKVADIDFRVNFEVKKADFLEFEKNGITAVLKLNHTKVKNAAKEIEKQLSSAITDAEKKGLRPCHSYHVGAGRRNGVAEWTSLLSNKIEAEIKKYYDFQAYRAVFLENKNRTHPGGFGPRDIHPNATAVEVKRTLADCRADCHPLGKGRLSQSWA